MILLNIGIDEQPYVSKLLTQQAQQMAALRNSRTLGYRANLENQQKTIQQQIQYIQQQQQLHDQQFRSNNSSNLSGNSSTATTNSLIDPPLIPSLSSASTNYLNMTNNQTKQRLAMLPAIVKDNGKTTILCGENVDDLRDCMQQQPDIQQQQFNQYNRQNLVTVLNNNGKIMTTSTNGTNDQGINI